MPKEKRRTPRFACNGAAGIQLAPGLVYLPAKIANLSADGCLIELQKPQRLSQDTIAELTFTINDQPFRMWGRVRAIRTDTTIGFKFLHLSDRVRRRLSGLLEQLIEDFITGASPRSAGEQRRFPRIQCNGTGGIQIVTREAFIPATIMDLSSRGCLMAFQLRQRLAQDSFIELKFDVNHLPFRTRGQVKGIRSATLAGFSFPQLSTIVQRQLDDLVEELLKSHIKRISRCSNFD
jgi:hypothetical protein